MFIHEEAHGIVPFILYFDVVIVVYIYTYIQNFFNLVINISVNERYHKIYMQLTSSRIQLHVYGEML